MVWKNLFRRKFRTSLTILGISIGVAAIIGLGALADGFQAGYQSLLTGSKADLVLSQPNSFDITYSSAERVIGIYQTGDGLEDSGCVLGLSDAQDLLGKPRQVSLFYIQVDESSSTQTLIDRVERLWPALSF